MENKKQEDKALKLIYIKGKIWEPVKFRVRCGILNERTIPKFANFGDSIVFLIEKVLKILEIW